MLDHISAALRVVRLLLPVTWNRTTDCVALQCATTIREASERMAHLSRLADAANARAGYQKHGIMTVCGFRGTSFLSRWIAYGFNGRTRT